MQKGVLEVGVWRAHRYKTLTN